MSTEPFSSPTSASPPQDLYAQVEAYAWDTDPEFQGGLSAILGSSPSPEQASELALRARCFYFARKFDTHVDFDAYKAYRASQSLPPLSDQPSRPSANGTSTSNGSGAAATASSGGTPADAPYPTSFQDIVELITSGKPIPGIKEIPSTVLEGQGTQASKAKRRKPWESGDVTSGITTIPVAGRAAEA